MPVAIHPRLDRCRTGLNPSAAHDGINDLLITTDSVYLAVQLLALGYYLGVRLESWGGWLPGWCSLIFFVHVNGVNTLDRGRSLSRNSTERLTIDILHHRVTYGPFYVASPDMSAPAAYITPGRRRDMLSPTG
jgi:hypothetical protein